MGTSLEKVMAAHPGVLVWEILWTEEPGRLQSMESQSGARLSHSTTIPKLIISQKYPSVVWGEP